MSVCATCTGLQRHLREPDRDRTAESPSTVRWVTTTLPQLRISSKECRACALILQGILLHRGLFATIKEDRVRVIAETFYSVRSKTSQDHLSVEVRWKEQLDECDDTDDHDHEEICPDLKLEFYTDDGKFPQYYDSTKQLLRIYGDPTIP